MGKSKGKRTYHRAPDKKIHIIKPIRLSQCMIVKNEEKNIEKALTWAKGVAFEQIVVDTGSTDRTVEIAESMGAKVYHFEWIDDFSAAKNFAIEQCSGSWIAFLDADEYFPKEDVKKLMLILRNIENDPTLSKLKTAIRCQIVNVDDKGKPFMALKQDRVFRNVPELRYVGRIHEVLDLKEPHIQAPELSIVHTGYSASSYAETNKASRNVEMIRKELSNDPDNITLKCYLADSLRIDGETHNDDEAEALYREALASGQQILDELKQGAYNFLIAKYYEDETKIAENFEFCRKAYDEFPDNPDFCFYYGRKLYLIRDFQAAWEKFEKCEDLMNTDMMGFASYIIRNPLMLFYQMVITAEEMGNVNDVIKYATIALKEDKNQPGMLAPYIDAFRRPGYETSNDEVFELLGKLYDFNDVKDKLTVMRAAKTVGNMELVSKVLAKFTPEELKWLTESPE